MSKVVRCFLDTNMCYQHDSLNKIARKGGMTLSSLEPGEYVVFINKALNKIKLFANNNVFAYCRLDKGRRIDLKVISEIPSVFESTKTLNYDQALEAMLTKRFRSPV